MSNNPPCLITSIIIPSLTYVYMSSYGVNV